jgi:hypothetical protein
MPPLPLSPQTALTRSVGVLLGALDQVLPWRVLLGLALACEGRSAWASSTGRAMEGDETYRTAPLPCTQSG